MNKTKKVAWHKHLKRARKAKDKAHALRAQATRAARGASGTHAHASAARSSARHTAPKQP